MNIESFNEELAGFIDAHKGEMVDSADDSALVVEDYVLIVAVRDLASEAGGVFSYQTHGTPFYRPLGLLHTVLSRFTGATMR